MSGPRRVTACIGSPVKDSYFSTTPTAAIYYSTLMKFPTIDFIIRSSASYEGPHFFSESVLIERDQAFYLTLEMVYIFA